MRVSACAQLGQGGREDGRWAEQRVWGQLGTDGRGWGEAVRGGTPQREAVSPVTAGRRPWRVWELPVAGFYGAPGVERANEAPAARRTP